LQHAACNGSWGDLDRFDFAQVLSNFVSAEFPNVVAEVLVALVEHSHSLGEAKVVYLDKKSLECVGRVIDVLADLVRQRNSRSRHLGVVLDERESCGMCFDARERAIGWRLVF
jgi:hypothetical protein